MTREELQSLLDAHGADPARWPAEARTAAMRLIAGDAEAARMLREAQALERLLAADAPPPAPLPAEALARAVMARAEASAKEDGNPDHKETHATVIPFPSASNGGKTDGGADLSAGASPLPPAANDDRPLRWMAAGVLAASLMLGVLLGGTLSASPVGEQLLEPVRMALADDGLGEIVQLASPADGGDLP